MVRLLDRAIGPFAVDTSREENRLFFESLISAALSFVDELSKYLRILSSILFTLIEDEDASYCFFILKDDGDFGFVGGFGR